VEASHVTHGGVEGHPAFGRMMLRNKGIGHNVL
jgi:hypothetical protein